MLFLYVSIHATLVGGDVSIAKELPTGELFLSTPPTRVATDSSQTMDIHVDVSIHATLVGGDPVRPWNSGRCRCFYPRHPRGWRRYRARLVRFGEEVSIHATLVGGDDMHHRFVFLLIIQFLSTPPSWVATLQPQFQPLPPFLFLSTPPSWVATTDPPYGMNAVSVSIHATLVGGDDKHLHGRA